MRRAWAVELRESKQHRWKTARVYLTRKEARMRCWFYRTEYPRLGQRRVVKYVPEKPEGAVSGKGAAHKAGE